MLCEVLECINTNNHSTPPTTTDDESVDEQLLIDVMSHTLVTQRVMLYSGKTQVPRHDSVLYGPLAVSID
jgi:hypothetical protein